MTAQVIQRDVPDDCELPGDLHPVIRRVYAARGIRSGNDLDYSLNRLLPYSTLKHIDDAIALLEKCLRKDRRILVVADFDADGATSCAVALRSLRAMGAKHVDYIVPNRFDYGYGLTPEIVDVAAERAPDLIITVDNGISSIAGVRHARELGMDVLVTDHHLPGPELPAATVIVNPNQPGDTYASKSLAGVGVIFNIMIALRAHLRRNGWFSECGIDEFNLACVLDLVALGTVADVVPLDHNNRIMVAQGLARIRAGQCCAGIFALLDVSGRRRERIVASDLGFAIGPRLNAAGRLTDMSLGIECLLTDDTGRAMDIARQLHDLNLERRQIQSEMELSALEDLESELERDRVGSAAALCLYREDWHQGVVGILASRIKEKFHRPVIVFAPDKEGRIKGSGRSINGVHIRDVLESISSHHPGVIEKFGGHAMAAGLSIAATDLERFGQLFDAQVRALVDEEQLQGRILTDGELTPADLSFELAQTIHRGGPWGQGFPEPLFRGEFDIVERRIVGEKHLRLELRHSRGGAVIQAIAFNTVDDDWDENVRRLSVVYRLDINEFRGSRNLQLMVEQLSPRTMT